MIDRFLSYFNKIGNVLKDINFGMIIEVAVNLLVISIIFKFLDTFTIENIIN